MYWEQISFFFFIGGFCMISVTKTLDRFRDSKNKNKEIKAGDKKKLIDRTASTTNNEEYQKKEKIKLIKLIINFSAGVNNSFVIIGSIAETYSFGVKMFGNAIAVFLGYIYAFFIVMPLMVRLEDDIKTPYQYFERRYGNRRYVRVITAIVGLLFYFLFLTLYLYGCSVILKQLVPTFPLWSFSVMIGVYSIIGSTLGGFTQTTKTNFFQFFVILIGMFTAICLTFSKFERTMKLNDIFDFLKSNRRLVFFDKSVDFSTRYTILNQLLSLSIPWTCFHSLLLPNFMRYRSVQGSALKKKLVAVSNFPSVLIVNTIGIISGGICCYLYFYGCNPLRSNQINNINLLGTYWFFSIFSDKFPVFTGILFASITSFSIVQHSLGITLIANTLYTDILGNLDFLKLKSEFIIRRIKIFLIVLIGFVSILFSISFKILKNSTASLFFLFNNTTNSPILGLYLLSAFNPFANHFGAMSAFIINILINYWLGIGSLNLLGHSSPIQFPETQSIELCEKSMNITDLRLAYIELKQAEMIELFNYNITIEKSQNVSLFNVKQNQILKFLYSIAPIWYCLFSVLFNLIFGSLLSIIYSLYKTGTIDVDTHSKEKRKNYLYF